METINRNNRVVALKRQGVSVIAIATELGMTASEVRYVLRTNSNPHPGWFPIPNGISLRAAYAVQAAIGCWPVPENAEGIARQRRDLLRSNCVRSRDLKEVDEWLMYLTTAQAPSY